MTATIPTQEDVDRVARELAPDVVRIRMMDWFDWTEDPALYFRVVIADDASRPRTRLSETSKLVRRTLKERLGLENLDHHSYFKFRRKSEQDQLRDNLWE